MDAGGKPRRIIDISSPGESAPNASSRPIIVSHKPSVQDPMVGNPAVPSSASNAEKIPMSHPAPQVQTEPQPESPQPAIQDNQPQPPAGKNLGPSHIKQLVHDRTYFMPLGQPPRRNGAVWFLVALVVVLVAAAGAYLALAG